MDTTKIRINIDKIVNYCPYFNIIICSIDIGLCSWLHTILNKSEWNEEKQQFIYKFKDEDAMESLNITILVLSIIQFLYSTVFIYLINNKLNINTENSGGFLNFIKEYFFNEYNRGFFFVSVFVLTINIGIKMNFLFNLIPVAKKVVGYNGELSIYYYVLFINVILTLPLIVYELIKLFR
ncbi:hypothetical protein [Heterosigma akashiwo virus 01]|jgi:hypothetical protein|uniref:Uncharacterized protein n=1 Tax=Heterosigma akashiwo virus 01 TaxID=97195 RepID=A0A1C9C5F5_HAV01|nr:hypothetical protein D1R72_gp193 [Heterosigma akashiwo virus 01]AOM63524.1 hypothetical protein [Heterosigma akashiwo virus 01]